MVPTIYPEENVVSPLDQAALNDTPERNEKIQDMQLKKITIQNLQSRLNRLYQILARPQIINLRGFEDLQLQSVSHSDIKQRVNILFFEANIPSYWKTKTKWTHPTQKKTDVHITFLNHFVKERAQELLLNFLQHKYNKIIYID
jgi:hypothetical protein